MYLTTMKNRPQGVQNEIGELLDGYDEYNDKHEEILKNFTRGLIGTNKKSMDNLNTQ